MTINRKRNDERHRLSSEALQVTSIPPSQTEDDYGNYENAVAFSLFAKDADFRQRINRRIQW
eukprot:scaffold7970_cov118-Cylindrotheca_fusiformis.AAC.4